MLSRGGERGRTGRGGEEAEHLDEYEVDGMVVTSSRWDKMYSFNPTGFSPPPPSV